MALSVHIKKKLKDFELAVDFDMDEGIVGFLGSSGCGKSMTLKCIAGDVYKRQEHMVFKVWQRYLSPK